MRFHEIHDAQGTLVGQFYLDLYAREGKQSGAWMDDAINRRYTAERLQHPVAYLTCNFPGPVGDRPAHLTHRELTTLFHEFGHGLHQLLTRVDVAGVSGLQGVEWDAVELPSQLDGELLLGVGRARIDDRARDDRRAAAARALRSSMLAARNFESGMAMVRQLEFALFDMLLHSACEPDGSGAYSNPQAVLDAARREVAVVPRPAYDRFMHAFGHIFAGSYGAGYYSYLWSEVLSSDAYSLFEETRRAVAQGRRAIPRRGARARRDASRARIVRRVPRPATADRCASAP